MINNLLFGWRSYFVVEYNRLRIWQRFVELEIMFRRDAFRPQMIYLVAEVFEHPQFNRFTAGTSGVVYEPIRRTQDIGFQDNISSIRLYRGPAFASAPNFKMVCYEDVDFQGRRLVLAPGFYGHLSMDM